VPPQINPLPHLAAARVSLLPFGRYFGLIKKKGDNEQLMNTKKNSISILQDKTVW
jgi:hypothetical protein